jgi:hypothetical protein
MKEVLILVNQPDFQQLMDIYLDEKKKEYYRILELLNKMKNMKVEVQTKAKRG